MSQGTKQGTKQDMKMGRNLDRRAFLNACSAAGITSPLLPWILFTLAAQGQESAPASSAHPLPKITPEMLDQAAELAGVGPFTADQKKMMLDGLSDQRDSYAKIRALNIANSVPPAYAFHPQPALTKEESHVATFNTRQQLSYTSQDAPVPQAP